MQNLTRITPEQIEEIKTVLSGAQIIAGEPILLKATTLYVVISMTDYYGYDGEVKWPKSKQNCNIVLNVFAQDGHERLDLSPAIGKIVLECCSLIYRGETNQRRELVYPNHQVGNNFRLFNKKDK